jgi:uncharacterized membrane protein
VRTSRLEAFSDAVLAIIITVMVLELHVPENPHLAALWHHSATGLLTYLLSFVYIGIYWNNHHHMFSIVEHVNGGILWANLHLMFWLSLFPFTTAWVSRTDVARTPVVIYGVDLLAAGIAYYLLEQLIFRTPGGDALRDAVGADLKGKVSPVIYLAGIALAFVNVWLAIACYVAVAVIWLVPDRRVERFVTEKGRIPDER